MAGDSINPGDSMPKKDDENMVAAEARKLVQDVMKTAGVFDGIVDKVDKELDQSKKKLEFVAEQPNYGQEDFENLFGTRSADQGQAESEIIDDMLTQKDKADILSGFGIQEKLPTEDDLLLNEITESILRQLSDDRRLIPNPTKSRESFGVINDILNDATIDDLSKKFKIKEEAFAIPDSSLQVYAAMVSDVLGSDRSSEQKVKEISGENGHGGINARFSFLGKRIVLDGDESTRNTQMNVEIDRRFSHTVKACIQTVRENSKEEGEIAADNKARELIDKAMDSAENAYHVDSVEKNVKAAIKQDEVEFNNVLSMAGNVKFDPKNAATAFQEIKAIADESTLGDTSRISEISDKALKVSDASLQVYAAMVLKLLKSEKSADEKVEELNGKEGLNEQFAFLAKGEEIDLVDQTMNLLKSSRNSAANHNRLASSQKRESDINDDDWDAGRFIKEGIESSIEIADKKEKDSDEKQQDESAQEEGENKKDDKKEKKKSIKNNDLKDIVVTSGRVAAAIALAVFVPGVGALLGMGFLLATQGSEKDVEKENLKEQANDLKKIVKDIENYKDEIELEKKEIKKPEVDEIQPPKHDLEEYNTELSNTGGAAEKAREEEDKNFLQSQEQLNLSQTEIEDVTPQVKLEPGVLEENPEDKDKKNGNKKSLSGEEIIAGELSVMSTVAATSPTHTDAITAALNEEVANMKGDIVSGGVENSLKSSMPNKSFMKNAIGLLNPFSR